MVFLFLGATIACIASAANVGGQGDHRLLRQEEITQHTSPVAAVIESSGNANQLPFTAQSGGALVVDCSSRLYQDLTVIQLEWVDQYNCTSSRFQCGAAHCPGEWIATVPSKCIVSTRRECGANCRSRSKTADCSSLSWTSCSSYYQVSTEVAYLCKWNKANKACYSGANVTSGAASDYPSSLLKCYGLSVDAGHDTSRQGER
eukprot:TRINITY_DN60296_c0_g1_i1.p1 TRINITY_DN60296_c0_g1~~TRINITY_DN60296_c0_g1_i1.p1  ORF type:complete len:203 (-),score=14.07 TRINITY_DN60296_c0_g1_i1:79-687(-)